MIAPRQGEEAFAFGMPVLLPILKRDLQRDLHGRRSIIAIEDPGKAVRSGRDELGGKPGSGFMRRSGQRTVHHPLRLPSDRVPETRMAVSKVVAPP